MNDLFVTTSTFFSESVQLQADADIISDWLREHGRPGDIVESQESLLTCGVSIIIRHKLGEVAA